jgi:hypothetical protein
MLGKKNGFRADKSYRSHNVGMCDAPSCCCIVEFRTIGSLLAHNLA